MKQFAATVRIYGLKIKSIAYADRSKLALKMLQAQHVSNSVIILTKEI